VDVDVDLIDGHHFEKQAGGAPANVCATIAKLGGQALFSGKVGNDPFGHFLRNTLKEINVDTSMLILDEKYPTTLAFVSLMENGERDFLFNRGADAYLTEMELDKGKLESAKVLHFGSATALIDMPFQTTYLNVMRTAKEKGKFVSFDPNYRSDLWEGRESDFIELAKQAISYADFVKVSDEELKLISGEDELEKGIQLLHELGVSLIATTLGKDGTLISSGQKQEIIPGLKINAIDTTGAGDSFVGAMLFQFATEINPKSILSDFERLKDITLFSNKVAGIVCTKIGAISALPTLEEVIS
jgi:fructokinase